MNARKKTARKPKSSRARKRRLAQKQSSALNFETLESRQLLAAFTVSNNTDVLSTTADTSSISALIANDGGDGISLREAVVAANNTVGEDTITFDTNVFTGGANSLVRLNQRLSVGDSLTVDASSVGGVVITGDVGGDDITVLGSQITDVPASFGDGSTSGNLLRDNVAVFGFTFAGRTSNLTLTQLTITGGETFGAGGAIEFESSGTLTLNQSAVLGNRANGGGGGIYAEEGSVVLNNSTVADNRAYSSAIGGRLGGGGIFSMNGDVSLVNSTVSRNSSISHGGGIGTSSGNVSLINSTVSNNSTTNSSPTSGNGGGIRTSSGIISLTSSTVSGNSAVGRGGGINVGNSYGDVSLINSTVSGNSAADGGGLSVTSATLVNSTVADNSASGIGGGVSLLRNELTLQNSIVAGNADNGTAPDIAMDPNNFQGFSMVVEYSLIGDTTGSGIVSTTGTGNILNQRALLAPLSDNGGPTLTHGLALGSLAIDEGSNALATGAGLTTDQRGEARILDGAVDIGAVEQSDLVLVVTQLADENDSLDLNINTADFNDLSLREAIAIANEAPNGGTISFDLPGPVGVPQVIAVDSQLTITSSITIGGLGANLLTLDGQGGGDNVLNGDGFRIFEVNDGDSTNSVDVSISGLTLTGGDNSDSGGAIRNFENLTLDGVSIVDNRASFGGGVSNEFSGILTITSSTIANNEVSQDGGGIFTRGELSSANVTISGNDAAGSGGAIVVVGDSSGTILSLTHATLTNNTGIEGVHFDSNIGPTVATFNNTILDSSITSVGTNGSTLTGGYNLFTSSDPGITGTGNLFYQTPLLAPLADNGGPTLTHALLSGSPAVNSGSFLVSVDPNGSFLLTDQRGENRNRFGAVDIGALETEFTETSSLVVNISTDISDPFDGRTSLREAIAFANDSAAGVNNDGDADGDGLESDTISFDGSVFTGGAQSLIRLAEGELVIESTLTIDGSSVGGVVITGDTDGDDITVAGTHLTDVTASIGSTAGAVDDLLDDNSGVLRLFGSTNDLTLTDLTITGGGEGGIRAVSFSDQNNNLRLNQSTVRGNRNDEAGGGIRFTGDLFLTNSNVSENHSGDNGGGVYTSGDVFLTNSTVSGNSSLSSSSRADGGGIFALGVVSLANSTVSFNSSRQYGGGIRSTGVILLGSKVIGNTTGVDANGIPINNRSSRGGGIETFFDGPVTLFNSIVSGNTSGGDGGGIRADGNLSIINSTVSGNFSHGDGGGIFAESNASLTNSTVSWNSSVGSGGGLAARSGEATLTNSTVSGNNSGGDGGGAWFYGATALLVNNTVTENSAAGVGGGIRFGDSVFSSDESFTLYNSIVAGNTADGTASDVGVVDSLVDASVVEHSLIGDTTGAGITFATGAGNILNQLPLLGRLANNGGPSQTHDLLAGSPALNSGSNAIANTAGLNTDQRGEDRILAGTVDIGAFEVDSAARVVVTTNQDIVDQTDGVTSLREAIAMANGDLGIDTITFDPSVFNTATTINISSQLPTITDGLTITGPSASILTINAQGGGDNVLDGNGFRIFEVNDGDPINSVDVSINGLTLTGGDNNVSGGAISNFENLTLDGISIVGNRASFGGGISNELLGVLTVTNSTIANNQADQDGGGIFNSGVVNTTTVTISGNSAVGNGGAIVTEGNSSGAALILNQSTIANNIGNEGVHFSGGNGPTIATFNNTIIEDTITGVGSNGTTLAGGNNLFAGGDPGITGTGNLFNQTARLGPLADNGGSTLTHTLLYGSPAFNAGSVALAVDQAGNLLIADQRGEGRIQFNAVDIGAVETELEATRRLVVTTTLDVVDSNDGVTSLREAIAFANDSIAGTNNDGDADGDGFAADTITFDASVFTGGDNSLIRLTQGELEISQSLTIDGGPVGGVVITGDANGNDITFAGTHITDVSASFGGTVGALDDLLDDNSRVLSFYADSGDLTLTELTITGGRRSTTGDNEDGGGIRFGEDTVFDFVGTLTLNQSTVSGNSTIGLDYTRGNKAGGIESHSGNILLIDSTVSRNYASIGGGGIRTVDGNVSLVNSTVSENYSRLSGGGIQTSIGDVSLTNSTVSGNSAGGSSGGGIRTGFGDVTLTNSTVSENVSAAEGGGILSRGDISLTNSTVSGNSATSGGGISTTGDAVLTNSTVSGNSATSSAGGGIATSGDLTLSSSTVSNNTSSSYGGGIQFDSQNLTLHNSIVAGNTDDGTAPDLRVSGSRVVEYSLIGDTSGSGISAATGTRNILNQLPLLGPLADNGGPTQTHALLSGSPAINGGSNAIANAAGLTADQRGEDRIEFGSVDVGAFESELNERTWIVTTDQDVEDQSDGLIALRDAILFSNDGDSIDTIIFDSGVFSTQTTINISSQLPTITDDLTIVGPGANLVIIDALGGGDDVLDGDGFRIFEVNDGDANSSIDVSISGLTLTGGDTSGSGGAVDNFENLTLDGVAIVGNRASLGGGVSNAPSGALTITNSTIAGNEAGLDGGGVFSRGELTATNVTISGNSAAGNGSAIATAGDSSGATLNLTHSTLTSNIGSAIHFDSVNGSTLATFHNTIIDGSVVGVGVNGTTLAGGYNLFTDADPGINGTGNLFSQTAMLGPLVDNGGSTLTHPLLEGSPAINAGSNALALDGSGNPLTIDQRGQARNQFGTVDIGALETEFLETRSLVVTTNLDVVDGGDELTSLREAISFANFPIAGANFDGDADGDGLTADRITFDASIFTGGDNNVIRLTQGELSISDGLTIDGASVGGVLVTGDASDDDVTVEGTHITNLPASFSGTVGASDDLLDDNSRVLNFSADTGDLTLSNLTITGGRPQGNYEAGGGIHFNSNGTLTLTESVIRGNLASGSGGGVFATEVYLTNSTVSENSSLGNFGGGGGISAFEVTLIDSTVSGNSASGDYSGGGGIEARFRGLSAPGSVTLVNSTVSGNSTSGDDSSGGGIRAFDSVTLINSTVSGNSNTGGTLIAIFGASEGGGIFTVVGDVSLTNSTVSGNSSSDSGGGVASAFGDVSLTNSTVSGNNSAGDGGGIWVDNSTVLLVNSTVTGNSTLGIGGGIGFELGSSGDSDRLILHNSIVAGNTDGGTAPDVEAIGNVIDDLIVENSLVGDTTGSGITASTGAGNILNQLALLGPLAFNDGPTQTHALLPNSPAIDAGSNPLAVDENESPLTTDQRGEDRIFNGTVDIGAVEFDFVNPFLLGDVNQNGVVDFLDIDPFISLLIDDAFLDEADIDRDGDVDFLDIDPFISLLSGSPATPQPLLGDANLNSVVNFLDIQPFISLLSNNNFLDEADINRDGNVDFLDIDPFVSVLSSVGEAVTSGAFFVESPVSLGVSLVAAAEPEPLVSVFSAAEVPIAIETSLAKDSLAKDFVLKAVVANETVDAAIQEPHAALVPLDDLLAPPVTQTSQLPPLNTAVAGVTTGGTDVSPKAFAPLKYNFLGARDLKLRGFEYNVPLVQQLFLDLPVEDLGFADESGDGFPSANLSTEEPFSTVAELFDAHPESLDEVFDF